MHHSIPLRPNSTFAKRNKEDKRRPAGVSRRRKRHFQFETLEPRQVMSAASPLVPLQDLTGLSLADDVESYSSNTMEGELAILTRELQWAALQAGDPTSRQVELRGLSIPNDPMLAFQWHLLNSGQQTGNPDWQPIFAKPGEDINVAPVWNMGVSGAGVSVAVIDSGVQTNHPDLAANIDLSRQYNAFSRQADGDPIDITLNPGASHGTAVAGIIGAVAGNGIGGVGVAPGATLVPITFLDAGPVAIGNPVVDALRYSLTHGVDITNNSWGPAVNFARVLAGPTVEEILALRDSAIFGRDGLGMINVFASGNSAGDYPARPGFPGQGIFSTANYNGYANSRYVIAVTGVDHDGSYNNIDGTVTNYPEAGANVLVAAPTGSFALDIGNDPRIGSGIWTTDPFVLQNGRDTAGYNLPPDVNNGSEIDLTYDFWADPAYTSRMNGTSAAAPIVSGVIALMLEVNPNLSWRDVQEILVRSARQNDALGTQGNGAGATIVKNSWITNQTPIFHDPDPWLENIPVPPLTRILNPTLDPNITGLALQAGLNGAIYTDHYVGNPSLMTNGAGYTVSQGHGVYGEQMGYAHGTVDAELAVRLAQQWSTKGQTLPRELTFTTFVSAPGNGVFNLPAAERGNMATGFLIVPGGIAGMPGFIAHWNEYFAADPDFDPAFPYRGQSSFEFSVPANNTMAIESVDVKVSITGDASEALDHLRLMLVSPEGTFSELTNYQYDVATPIPRTRQDVTSDSNIFWGATPTDVTTGAFTWTFNTKRSWGERSNDAIIINPLTNEPVVDTAGQGRIVDGILLGDALKQGWRLVVENWDINSTFGLQGVEIAWHGSPIDANSQRVQGKIGIDLNGDDEFNYSRVVQSNVDLDLDGVISRYGEVLNAVDLTQEAFAANVTVTVRRTADGSLVDQFVTGSDGNFYFDLIPDDYTVTVEDPAGRGVKDDASTAGQFLRHFRSEWRITEAWFRAYDRDATAINEVLVDGTGTPQGWADGNGEFVVDGIRGLNFLLDPGAPVANEVTFTGTIYADVNGDGAYNGDDINMPNVTVFGDVNRNGQRDPGEVAALTGANGSYQLTVPLAANAIVNVAVQRPTQWTSTNDGPGATDSKTDGVESIFVTPGDVIGNVSFAIKPPANNIGGGGANQPGTLLGVVFEDTNGNGVRNTGESGAANLTVFLDNNNSGAPDSGDTITLTNEHGAFVFTNLPPGQRLVRLVVNSPLTQTTPAPGTGRVITLTGSSTVSNIQFGIKNSATRDYGDLPAVYGITLAGENGAYHEKSLYWLGQTIDTELDGRPSANADGDDAGAPGQDEDGITFGAIVPGQSATLIATASRANGVLQGWVDWNNDGDFNDVGERILTNRGLLAGANAITFQVPAGANVNQVYARFRYGGNNLGLTGPSQIGEVEDYQLNVAVPVVQVVGLPSDSDADGDSDGNDFLNWQRNLGIQTGATQAQGDANGDDRVTRADMNEWRQDFGTPAVPAAVLMPTDEDLAGASAFDVGLDGAGLALSQRQFSQATETKTFEASAQASTTLNGVSRRAEAPLRAAFKDGAFVDLVDGTVSERKAARRERLADEDDSDAKVWQRALDAELRRDRAFDDLFGTRRRQGMQADVEFEQADDAECDDAFALMADHFEWPVG